MHTFDVYYFSLEKGDLLKKKNSNKITTIVHCNSSFVDEIRQQIKKI